MSNVGMAVRGVPQRRATHHANREWVVEPGEILAQRETGDDKADANEGRGGACEDRVTQLLQV